VIEAIINYIQEKGYIVGVIPGCLLIRKMAKGRQWGINWAISKVELRSLSWDLLTHAADQRLELMEKAIEGYQ